MPISLNLPISLCFVYLDVKQPGNAQLAPGMAIIHHVVLHSLWSRHPIIFYMKVSQGSFQTILFLRTMDIPTDGVFIKEKALQSQFYLLEYYMSGQ